MKAADVKKALGELGRRKATERAAPLLDEETLRKLGLAIKEATESEDDAEDESE